MKPQAITTSGHAVQAGHPAAQIPNPSADPGTTARLVICPGPAAAPSGCPRAWADPVCSPALQTGRAGAHRGETGGRRLPEAAYAAAGSGHAPVVRGGQVPGSGSIRTSGPSFPGEFAHASFSRGPTAYGPVDDSPGADQLARPARGDRGRYGCGDRGHGGRLGVAHSATDRIGCPVAFSKLARAVFQVTPGQPEIRRREQPVRAPLATVSPRSVPVRDPGDRSPRSTAATSSHVRWSAAGSRSGKCRTGSSRTLCTSTTPAPASRSYSL